MLSLRVVVLVALVGCYRGPDKRDDEIVQRLKAIEQRLDVQDKAIAQASSRADTTELSVLAEQIAELSRQVTTLGDSVKTAPRPSPVKRREPDRSAVYSVPVTNSPVLGSPKAKVTLVMAMEFDCPYCHKAFNTVDELRKKYGTDLRVVYKPYVVHPRTATAAAHAACAAQRQGRWREMVEALWTKAFEQRSQDPKSFDQANIDAIATDVGLDMRQYNADIANACVTELRDEMSMLQKLAVSATPAFFINGRYMSGAQPLESFSKLIDEELAKTNAALKRGVKVEKYYEAEVVAKGLTDVPHP